MAGSEEQFHHPWLLSAGSVQKAKMQHVISSTLITFQSFYDPLGLPDDPDTVAPLVSQPIVELCLQIPTYFHMAGGWGRSMARRAFMNSLPQEIIARRTKGGIDEFAKAVFLRNIDFVKPFLLDGELVRAGMLDRGQLEEVLSGRPTGIRTTISELYDYLSAEAWVGAWTNLHSEKKNVQRGGYGGSHDTTVPPNSVGPFALG
jgi:asparagine synthase (glutamine-hydrolysing)